MNAIFIDCEVQKILLKQAVHFLMVHIFINLYFGIVLLYKYRNNMHLLCIGKL